MNGDKTLGTGVASIQLFGDIALDGLYCDPRHHEHVSQSMMEISQTLGECDLRIANLESPIWAGGGVNRLKQPRLSTTLEAAKCILPLKLDVALLANNHIYDCLSEGFRATTSFLDDNGIAWLGAGFTQAEAARPLVLERQGLKIGLLNYVGPETNPNLPRDAEVFVNWLVDDTVVSDVVRLKSEVDIVVVLLHWGAAEYVRYPEVSERTLARRIVDAGATLVVGCHAHLVQGDERWKAGHIFYGLGNFLFSPAFWSSGRSVFSWNKWSRSIGVAKCQLSAAGIKDTGWEFLYHERDDLALRWDNAPKKHRAHRRLCRPLAFSDSNFRRLSALDRRFSIPLRMAIEKRGGLLSAACSLRFKDFKILFSLFLR